jgi:acyl-CoA synthetase (AMP-forming)/AMP-acid ligase II
LESDTSPYDLSRLRYITNAGAALNTTLIAKLRERFPGAVLYSMYGLTETKRTLFLPPSELGRRPESVGIAIPGTEVWLVDENDQRLGPHQVGELVVRGGHVMRGYWNDPVGTAARFRPGPLPGETVCYSGDLFRRDEEGFYYFVARKDDILKCRGEKVAPKEVEEVLSRLSDVYEAAVIGVPDLKLGQAIKAFVVRRSPELTEKDVLRHCRAHLEDFMIPHQIVFVDELPKNANGKIQKSLLQ